MAERTVTCPRCGRKVDVPTTGEKARCPGCGQKFRFDAASAPEPPPEDARPAATPPPLPGKREIHCPSCRRVVDVPTTGEKVLCPGCGRKFRFDGPPLPETGAPPELPEPEDETPEEPPAEQEPAAGEAADAKDTDDAEAPAASKVTCPRCGQEVDVPTSGEKVRCPGCGQKFRYDASAEPDEAPAGPPPLPPAPEPEAEAEAEASEVVCPQCGRSVSLPTSGEKIRCPDCGQKLRFGGTPEKDRDEEPDREEADEEEPKPLWLDEKPPPQPPAGVAPSTAAAEELRSLWPALAAFINRVYEDGEATDGDRVRFREEASRATQLAAAFLPTPSDDASAGHLFITSVLLEMTLDEILKLSLEDYRRLHETLDEARDLLAEHLPPPLDAAAPAPAPAMPALRPRAARPATPPAAVAAARRRKGVSPLQVGLALACAALVAAVLIGFPSIKAFFEGLAPAERPKEAAAPEPTSAQPARATTAQATKGTETRPASDLAVAPVPKFEKPDTPTAVPTTAARVAPSSATRPTSATVARPPKPASATPAATPAKRVFSRWKPAEDGWIALYDGKSLDGLSVADNSWSVEGGILYGRTPDAASTLTVRDANWTDYHLQLDVALGKTGSLVIAHGSLTASLSSTAAQLASTGRVLDERSQGLDRREWYHVEFDVKGSRAELRVNGTPALATAAWKPQPGPPAVKAIQGGIALRTLRARIHETDPNYRAVALGEGYVVSADTPPPTSTDTTSTPRSTATLGPGTHRLFNGKDLDGWTPNGAWRVQSGAIGGRAAVGPAATLAAGSTQWRDYTLQARCRIVRGNAIPREGEYFLIVLRYQDADNFFCVRFAVEGIYEIGYYRNGRFRETGRARFGLGSKFNAWRNIQATVRGNSLSLVIDKVGGMPPWPIPAQFAQGAVGLGVTGGQAAFQSANVRVVR